MPLPYNLGVNDNFKHPYARVADQPMPDRYPNPQQTMGAARQRLCAGESDLRSVDHWSRNSGKDLGVGTRARQPSGRCNGPRQNTGARTHCKDIASNLRRFRPGLETASMPSRPHRFPPPARGSELYTKSHWIAGLLPRGLGQHSPCPRCGIGRMHHLVTRPAWRKIPPFAIDPAGLARCSMRGVPVHNINTAPCRDVQEIEEIA